MNFPVDFLPPKEAWQGSTTPYPLLLSFQIIIIFLFIYGQKRIASGNLPKNASVGKLCLGIGSIYLIAMVVRLFIGILDLIPDLWFHKPISSIFHMVIATYILLLSRYHLNRHDESSSP
jgi:hypothetical protein